MHSMKIIAVAFFALCSTSWAQACTGILMSDGTCISDPSITQEVVTTPVVQTTTTTSGSTAVDLSGYAPDSLPNTARVDLIRTRCAAAGYGGYSSPAACVQAEFATLTAERDAQIAAAKKKAAESSGNADQAQQQPQQQQQQPQQQAKKDEGGGEKAPEDKAAKDDSAQASSDEEGDGEGQAKNGECLKIIPQLVKACEKKKEAADVACDPEQHDGLKKVSADGKIAAVSVGSAVREQSSAVKSSILRKESADATKDFAGVCKKEHMSCQSECDSVKKTFEKVCKDPAQKQKVAKLVAKADEEKAYCEKDLTAKSTAAAAEAGSLQSSAEQGAGVSKTSSNSGGGSGGGMPDMSALAGLMKNSQEEKKKSEAEAKAVEEALAKIAAQEGMGTSCQRPEFANLEACVCYGKTAAQCAQSTPTANPTSRILSSEAPATLSAP